MLRPIATLAVALLMTACAVQAPDVTTPAAQVTGSVTYRQRIALPPSAVVRVQIADVSLADAPSKTLSEVTIQADGKQVPFQFALGYDPAAILPQHSYAVQARIENDGKLLFINDQRYPVITRGAPTHVDLVLRQVEGSTPR